eukprot:gene25200-10840_t
MGDTARFNEGYGQSTGDESPSRRMTGRSHTYTDVPSTKYQEREAVNKVTLRRAQSPPRPTLPRRPAARSWNSTAKERNPLTSCLTGPGRAGKYGELIAQSGSRYEGEVLAGRPHGVGKLFVPKGNGKGGFTLEYEGEWAQGTKVGTGTRYYPNGETYSGDFVTNVRHGRGRYFFANGDMYAGDWLDDKRTGHGTYYYANGDIFTGNFNKDCKEGMGTLYMMNRQRKYVAEYVKGQPKCGTMLDLDDEDLEPLRGQLKALALQKQLDMAASGLAARRLPEIELLQPNKVLGEQLVGVRKGRTEGTKDLKAVQGNSGSLSDKEIEMLRHSYTLMAGGDDTKVGLLPHQLRELCVMAGLDPAAEATRQLVELMLLRRNEKTGRIHFDEFMKVVIHFQEMDPDTELGDPEGEDNEEFVDETEIYQDDDGDEGVYEDETDLGMPSVAEDPVNEQEGQ